MRATTSAGMLALILGAVPLLSLPRAQGATACPPPSIAGSPNALTTSRPASSAPSSGPAACTKPAAKHAKIIAAPTAATSVPVTPVAAASAPTSEPSWRSALDPLTAGGWKYLSDGPAENPSAVYASSHSVMRNGNVVTAWIRWEFARPQADVYPLHYQSAVTREELDCDARAYRRSEVVYYTRNNLREKGPAFTALNDDTNWKQAIPGTEPDAMLNWGCTAPAAAKTSKPADAKPAAKPAAEAASSAPVPATVGGTDLKTAK